MSLLPKVGTPEREELEAKAIAIGLASLHDTGGNIPEALYQVYQHFRVTSEPHEARLLERHVSECWATAIVHANTLRQSKF